MFRFSLINLCLLILFSQSVQAREYKLVLLTENYPPFNMSIEDKNFSRESGIDGIATDIVRELMSRSAIKYSMTLRFPWKRIYGLTLKNHNYGLFSTTRTEAREELFQWVGPIVSNDWVAFVQAGSKVKINSLQDLAKYRVGGYKGDAIAEHLKANGIPVIEAHKDNANPKKLAEGKIDVWVSGDITGRYIADLEGFSGLRTAYRLKSTEMYLALNLDVPPEIVNKLQSTLDQMRADGTMDELTSRYQ
ncbi:ABC transporter substrate-binding protein [Aestuariirhabdus sp. Z084]|uniref:substrate-binding periplasmic protein n=1 Tax=Aestuariirhabdus haliotis TaxID=2918751 RepID=UPI00201B35DE|nr:ABC transporter substrate-binding protein [Aestuariirhabdus haliotis]MCL6416848.1 ABC transporter substrate-binding protein [Aestuariirhabdus haliotis]MCL6420876.1 ABC transporter substrate-binding protein [Aestuariirhabdus haliotis]